jgi:hypothetical protein
MKRFPTLGAILGLILGLLMIVAAPAHAGEWSGKVSFEGRLFPQSALNNSMSGSNLSFAFEPEWYQEWQNGRQLFLFVPFVRLDQNDPERTHWDIRELTWQYNARGWELRAGIRRVFWGVTESKHLVDIINQTDLTENIDGETKLGQPMVNLALIRSWGTVDVFALIGFRERRFFGIDSRPGLAFPLDTDNPIYESSRGRKRVDWAVRWSHAMGPWDIGVSHFHGTSRDPRFLPQNQDGELIFVPVYDLIDQTGLDLQMTHGGWLWKLETINRFGQGDRFMAFTGGFEYTFVNVRSSGLDLGILAEYSFDERGKEALTPLDNDIFVGTRLAFNDVQSTEILAGATIDRDTGASFINVEASRRFGQSWTLGIEARAFVGVPRQDLFLHGIRKDSYVQLSWSWHF